MHTPQVFQRVLRQNAFLIVTALIVLVAFLAPSIGANFYSISWRPLIALLFATSGLSLRLDEAVSALNAVNLHASIQFFSLLGTPFVFYLLFYTTGIAEMFLGSAELSIGTMAAMCMPTAANTNIMFTTQASGDVSLAIQASAIGNVLGAFISPIVAAVTIGGPVGEQNLWATLLSLTQTILAPLFIGILLQIGFRHWSPGLMAEGPMVWVKRSSSLVMLAILYLLFCKTFSSANKLSLFESVRLCVFIFILHGVIVYAAWKCAHAASSVHERRTAFILTAPQKTEAMGIAIIASIFRTSKGPNDNFAVMAFPIVVYHTVQMMYGAVLVGLLQSETNASMRENVDRDLPGYNSEAGKSDRHENQFLPGIGPEDRDAATPLLNHMESSY
jgi:predicted Na+-dependent transporter